MTLDRRESTALGQKPEPAERLKLPNKAMVLAGGSGKRLRPLTDSVHKCMVPIWGKPLMEYIIESLSHQGVKQIRINLCHLAETVMEHFGNGSAWGVDISYSIEDKPLGTAGGVKKAADFFDSTFFVWYGDNLSNCDLEPLYSFHRARGGLATIALHYREDPTPSGIVGLDEDGRITRFLEKPRPEQIFSHWVSAGIFVLEPEIIEMIPTEGSPDFGRDIFPALLAQGVPLYGYYLPSGEDVWWVDTPQDLEKVEFRTAHVFGPWARGDTTSRPQPR